jgi:hypothetical protein
MNNESLRDLHLSPSLVFNSHVHSTAFLLQAGAILDKGTRGHIAMMCCRRWGSSLVFPSTATTEELVKHHNIPLDVRASQAWAWTCVT